MNKREIFKSKIFKSKIFKSKIFKSKIFRSEIFRSEIFKFIYWIIMPMTIGAIAFYYLDKLEISMIYKFAILIMIAMPISAIRIFIGKKIFKEKPTLVEKIMSCNLRRKYGKDYCAKCTDSYNCVTNMDGA
jgi:hypothetical protein